MFAASWIGSIKPVEPEMVMVLVLTAVVPLFLILWRIQQNKPNFSKFIGSKGHEDRLAELGILRSKGVITEDEYQRQREAIIKTI